MKSFVVLAAVLACAAAKPGLVGYGGLPLGYSAYGYSTLGYGAPAVTYAAGPAVSYAAPAVTYAAPAVVAPAVTKTQYHAQDELGQSSHGYAYPGQAAAEVRDAAGNVRGSYAYINPNGEEIRVNYVADGAGFRVASNALPVAPAATLVGPAPVQDTPEVVAARAAHLAAVQEASARSGRKRRGLAYTYPVGAGAITYSAGPAITYSAAPALTHAYAAPATYTYAAPATYAYGAPAYSTLAGPVTYAAAPAVVAAGPALREATLTKIVNNPGHAVSYRVD
jgi:hypothetical protein